MELQVGGEIIETTGEHPFFVKDKGWLAAKELCIGDELNTLTELGFPSRLSAIPTKSQPFTISASAITIPTSSAPQGGASASGRIMLIINRLPMSTEHIQYATGTTASYVYSPIQMVTRSGSEQFTRQTSGSYETLQIILL